jgi:hypothetical protein
MQSKCHVRTCVQASERASVSACVRACERACVRASERACVRMPLVCVYGVCIWLMHVRARTCVCARACVARSLVRARARARACLCACGLARARAPRNTDKRSDTSQPAQAGAHERASGRAYGPPPLPSLRVLM